jgi:plasmid stability protein
MAQVLIRNVDEKVVQTLKERAQQHGHSLEQELREILVQAAQPSREDLVALSQRIRAMTPKDRLQSDSTDLIREDRDRR